MKQVAAIMVVATMGMGAAHADEVVNALPNGVAMDGFDVVAYFTAGEPTLGKQSHSVEYKGKTWLFRSAENASKFSASPDQYAPKHNGWCAYAVSEGYGAEVDFVNGWSIIDGNLYLNWNEATRDAFVEQQERLIELANEQWSGVKTGLEDGSVPLYTHAGQGAGIAHPQKPQ